MLDQRRHQRIRFFEPPPIAIGFGGRLATGVLENLSLAGFMVRTDLALAVGRHFGCEFSLFGSPVVDVSAITISRISDLFGARFEYGPISERVLEDAIEAALAQGKASIEARMRPTMAAAGAELKWAGRVWARISEVPIARIRATRVRIRIRIG